MNRVRIYSRRKIHDTKGWFIKIINGQETNLPNHAGEVYAVCGGVGESRAGHYHNEAKEWFTVIYGKVELKLTDINTGESQSIKMDSTNPITVFIPNQIAHLITNIGAESFIMIAYSDKYYDPDDTVEYR
jgi:dTDP-4-dehydrorhamnose 3,5-epimerase-like enzyme